MSHHPSSFFKSFILIICLLAMLPASWEYSKADAVIAQAQSGVTEDGVIPQESIRLRILADSDSPADQALKRRVRDVVIKAVNEWVGTPETLEEARLVVRSRLPELERLAAETAAEAGFQYGVKAEFGMVAFPTKVYGGKLYPAGDYEALCITLGRGLGQNWWCVLFPPLCFVDIAAAETPEDEEEIVGETPQAGPKDVQYRFFLIDFIADVIETIRSWMV